MEYKNKIFAVIATLIVIKTVMFFELYKIAALVCLVALLVMAFKTNYDEKPFLHGSLKIIFFVCVGMFVLSAELPSKKEADDIRSILRNT